MTTEGDFKILSISDDKAQVTKPAWFQNGGVGYQIQSRAGKLEITAKGSVNGLIKVWLMGVDVRNPSDKTKRVPYWIDYSKLTINGATIFDKVTPTWHDKAYIYNFDDAKADEEIKFQIEWLTYE